MSCTSPWQQPQRSSRLEAALAAHSLSAIWSPSSATWLWISPLRQWKTVQTSGIRSPHRQGKDSKPCRESHVQKPNQPPRLKLTKAFEAGFTEEKRLFQEKAEWERNKLWWRAWEKTLLRPGSCKNLLWKSRGDESKEEETVTASLRFALWNPESVVVWFACLTRKGYECMLRFFFNLMIKMMWKTSWCTFIKISWSKIYKLYKW